MAGPTYTAWKNMIARCDRPSDISYPNYGGRGITYDPRWSLYENFLADMGKRPERFNRMSLDRIDNDGNYSKANCRWATREEQEASKRISRNNTSGLKGVTFDPKTEMWRARIYRDYRMSVYHGPDFFEACCARKAGELRWNN